MNKITGFVTRIDSEVVVIAEAMEAAIKLSNMGLLGGSEQHSYFVSPIRDQEKYVLIEKLRDEGFAFSGGSGWSPSEIVEYERGQGHVSGNFLRISWQSEKSYTVTSF